MAQYESCGQKNPLKRLKNHMWGLIVFIKHYASGETKTDIYKEVICYALAALFLYSPK